MIAWCSGFIYWKWNAHEETWHENERNMKGQWKEMRGNERRMKGTWKQMNPKVWVLIPFDVVRYVVRTSFGRRSKQLTVSLQNPTGKIYMWWITGVPVWHECFLLYLIPLWRCFGSCVHKVFPHLSHRKTFQNRVCRTSASHWGWPYLTSWSNGVPMRFDTIILLNWSTLTVRSSSNSSALPTANLLVSSCSWLSSCTAPVKGPLRSAKNTMAVKDGSGPWPAAQTAKHHLLKWLETSSKPWLCLLFFTANCQLARVLLQLAFVLHSSAPRTVPQGQNTIAVKDGSGPQPAA